VLNMKRIILFLVFTLLLVSLVSAAYGSESAPTVAAASDTSPSTSSSSGGSSGGGGSCQAGYKLVGGLCVVTGVEAKEPSKAEVVVDGKDGSDQGLGEGLNEVGDSGSDEEYSGEALVGLDSPSSFVRVLMDLSGLWMTGALIAMAVFLGVHIYKKKKTF
jgi:hypothetical protein